MISDSLTTFQNIAVDLIVVGPKTDSKGYKFNNMHCNYYSNTKATKVFVCVCYF